MEMSWTEIEFLPRNCKYVLDLVCIKLAVQDVISRMLLSDSNVELLMPAINLSKVSNVVIHTVQLFRTQKGST